MLKNLILIYFFSSVSEKNLNINYKSQILKNLFFNESFSFLLFLFFPYVKFNIKDKLYIKYLFLNFFKKNNYEISLQDMSLEISQIENIILKKIIFIIFNDFDLNQNTYIFSFSFFKIFEEVIIIKIFFILFYVSLFFLFFLNYVIFFKNYIIFFFFFSLRFFSFQMSFLEKIFIYIYIFFFFLIFIYFILVNISFNIKTINLFFLFVNAICFILYYNIYEKYTNIKSFFEIKNNKIIFKKDFFS